MEGLCDFFHECHQASFKFDEQRDGFDATEIFIEDQTPQFREDRVSDQDVASWLDRRTKVQHSTSSGITASICIIWITIGDSGNKMDIRESNMDLILERFDLKRAFSYNSSLHHGLICLQTSHASSSTIRSYSLCFGYWNRLIWTHDTSTSKTNVVYIGERDRSDLMQQAIKHLKRLFWHPMFLAIAASAVGMQWLEDEFYDAEGSVVEVEQRTKHSRWQKTLWDPAQGSYAYLSANMSGVASTLADCEYARSIMEEVLTGLSAYTVEEKSSAEDEASRLQLEFRECIQLLQQRSRSLGSFIRSHSRRADVQLTAVSNSTFWRNTLGMTEFENSTTSRSYFVR